MRKASEHFHGTAPGAVIGIASLLVAACSPLPPPVRSAHGGAPGHLHRGVIEMSGAANYFASGEAALAYGMTDAVALEGGSGMRLTGEDTRWALGYGGVRTTLAHRDHLPGGARGSGYSGDAAVGFGLGAGALGAGPEEGDALDRTAGGGYLGGGFAGHAGEHFAGFVRTTLQLSNAVGTPALFWWSSAVGPEVTFGPASLYVSTAIVMVADDNGASPLWMPIEGGAALRFDASALSAPRTEVASW